MEKLIFQYLIPDLNPMTLTFNFDLDMVKISHHTVNCFKSWSLNRQTDTHTEKDRHYKNITSSIHEGVNYDISTHMELKFLKAVFLV